MLSRQGRANAHTLFGIDDIPCDNHVRKMLDGVPPGHAGPRLHHVIGTLLKKDRLEPLRRLNGHLLVALDGTEYVSSTEIECSNCSTQKQKDGSIRKFHAMVGASIVAPGSAELLPLPPEFITPRDGHDKQDCERAAVKRWLARVGPRAARLKPALRVMISIAASRSARRSGPPEETSCRSACRHPMSRFTNMFMAPA